MLATFDTSPFTTLTAAEMELLMPYASCEEFKDGEVIYKAGDEDVDVFVVESGGISIHNPHGGAILTVHGPGHFSGDIDVLTRRPIIVTGIAHGTTRVMRVPNASLREILMRIPDLSEKLLSAFQKRRDLLSTQGNLGLTILGPAKCRHTTELREFLYKNFVPFHWHDPMTAEGRDLFEDFGIQDQLPVQDQLPMVRCVDGKILARPSLQELARGAHIWKGCGDRDVDIAVIGAGPAGVCAAVYAGSEGLSTVVLDRLGPGGQAAGTSRIENFIGFPAGLSGADFSTRAVLQMLRFGASMVAPVEVKSIEPAADGGVHRMKLDCGALITSRILLIATGVHWRKLNADGADRFERSGVYYACTSVEALLHDGEDVVVVGAGNSAGQAAVFLSQCCPSRKVHLVIRSTLGPRMSEYLRSRIRNNPHIVMHERTNVTAVHGSDHIESVTLKGHDDAITELDVSAVFVFIGADPSAEFLPEGVARDDQGFILTGTDVVNAGRWPLKDRSPCPLETSVPGILAAGDIRSGSTKRVGFAVGDGALAVACAHKLLSIHR
jgi:thioredoxin reductase (NADPH)